MRRSLRAGPACAGLLCFLAASLVCAQHPCPRPPATDCLQAPASKVVVELSPPEVTFKTAPGMTATAPCPPPPCPQPQCVVIQKHGLLRRLCDHFCCETCTTPAPIATAIHVQAPQMTPVAPMMTPQYTPVMMTPQYTPQYTPVMMTPQYTPQYTPVMMTPQYTPQYTPVAYTPQFTPQFTPQYTPQFTPSGCQGSPPGYTPAQQDLTAAVNLLRQALQTPAQQTPQFTPRESCPTPSKTPSKDTPAFTPGGKTPSKDTPAFTPTPKTPAATPAATPGDVAGRLSNLEFRINRLETIIANSKLFPEE